VAPCPPAAAHVAAPAPERTPRTVDEPHARNLLGVESRLLTEARAQLRSGEPRAAMATLERLQTRFPKGVLLQEREVLTIQVLSALGDNASASRKAKAFLEAYPNSPHAPQLRRFTGE
jgi:outer membrane protein assembly factor BamD (BamD/ComL family)